jgi:CheY-like chemotaxis protein
MRPEAAEGAEQALAMIQAHAESGDSFQVVVTDLHMPVTDGFELVTRMRQRWASQQMVVLMVTSGEHPGDLARSRQLGIAAYLTKPVRRNELRTAMAGGIASRKCLQNLPRSAEPRTTRAPRPEIRPGSRRLRILLAEDTAVNQMVACAMLEAAGHTVEVARDGRQAVECMAKGPFDVVLMDIQMPEMDGFEATAAIREMEKHTGGGHTPVIAMTAHALSGYRELCLAAGMDDYLTKPIKRQLLLQTLEALPGRPEPAIAAGRDVPEAPRPGGLGSSGEQLSPSALIEQHSGASVPMERPLA